MLTILQSYLVALGDAAAAVEQMLENTPLPEGVLRYRWCDQRSAKVWRHGTTDGMGLILVYLVMVAQFESWTDPFVIMFSVPFAATGAFLAC